MGPPAEPSGRAARVFELFDRCADLEATERDAWLARECGADVALRDEVLSLLAHDDDESDTGLHVGRLSPASLSLALGVFPPDTHLGPYRIEEFLGSGGMGLVYAARHESGERVALKMSRVDTLSAEALRRFRHEAELLGRLRHPGIARVLDAGDFELGGQSLPYISMEYVDGQPLTKWARSCSPSTAERLAVVEQVCEALQHAHDRGIVHRDLKPANILVDASGRAKVLDFGVARAIGLDSSITTMRTRTGELLGTLPYMSPEQVSGDPDGVDARSDVYSLGVVLYELLTGSLPVEIGGDPLPEAARRIRVETPARLSTLVPELGPQLEVVVGRALSKRPTRRYASARAFGLDLQRFREGAPVLAKPPRGYDRVADFIARYPVLTAAASVVFLALSSALAISLWKTRVADRATQRALDSARIARLESQRATLALVDAALRAGDPLAAREQLDRVRVAGRGWEWRYYEAELDDSVSVSTDWTDALDLRFEAGGTLLVARSDGSIARLTHARLEATPVAALAGGPWSHAAFSANGEALALASEAAGPSLIRVGRWAREPWDSARTLSAGEPVESLTLDEAGDRVAWTTEAGHFQLHDLATDRAHALAAPRFRLRLGGPTFWGDRLATAGRLGGLRLYSFDENEPRLAKLRLGPLQVEALRIVPGGDRIVLGLADKRALLVRVDDDWLLPLDETRDELERSLEPDRCIERAFIGHAGAVELAETTPDGRWLATASADRTIRLWELETGRLVRVFNGHRAQIVRLRIDEEGQRLASLDRSGELRTWEAGERNAIAERFESFVYAVACSPDGVRVASSSWDRVLRIRDEHEPEAEEFELLARSADQLIWSPDGSALAALSRFKAPLLFQGDRGRPPTEIAVPGGRVSALAWLHDGEHLLVAGRPKAGVRSPFLRLLRYPELDVLQHHEVVDPALCALALDANGPAVALGTAKGVVELRDDEGLELRWRAPVHDGEVNALAADPSGRWLASASSDGTACLIDAATGALVLRLDDQRGEVWDVEFAPGGNRLVTACHDGAIRFHDLESGMLMATLRGHEDYVKSLDFSADGTRLYSASGDRTVRVWDTRARSERER